MTAVIPKRTEFGKRPWRTPGGIYEVPPIQEVARDIPGAEETNYRARSRVAFHDLSSEEVSAIYPRPSRDVMYRQNLHFVDVGETGQVYPGFPIEVPRLDED